MAISMAGLQIRQDYSPADLRTRATREKDCRAALRLLAIANALEGMTQAEATRLAGMERQALHDAIKRFNAEGPDGLHDRPRTGARNNSLRVSRLCSRHISCPDLSRSVMG
jgi:hypothetical protein